MLKRIATVLLVLSGAYQAVANGQSLWYQQPPPMRVPPRTANSAAMNAGLPIGNGRIGGMVMGFPAKDYLPFNEDSLWTGSEQVEGSYQAFATLRLNLPGHDDAKNYRRALDIGNAVASVTYKAGGVNYRREYFASYPAGVMFIRLTADKAASYSGDVSFDDAHTAVPTAVGSTLLDAGALDNGLKYEAQLAVLHEGGSVESGKTANGVGRVAFSRCDSVTLILAVGTDYLEDYAKSWRGPDPHDRLALQIASASAKPYAVARAEHLADYHKLYNRVTVDLGTASAEQASLPTDERILRVASRDDPALEALLFQYGRYNLIASSRDALPANLQGLWNDSNTPAWHSDYHANINIEMNYWPAEPANLGELALPFLNFIEREREAWKKGTVAEPQFKLDSKPIRGWAIRTSNNIYGHTDWRWDLTANAWYCQHLWDHYTFGGDKAYLATQAYPIMKEVVEFWEDHLIRLPAGRLAVHNGWSPEHGPTQDGVSYTQEIVWDLFDNYVQAADTLGTDRPYRDKVMAMRDKLVVPGIGKWGQLNEWMNSPNDPNHPELDTPNDHHRHTSQLFGLYPGHQFSLTGTPALAAASEKTLRARGDTGDSRRQWVWAWRAALWARLGDAEMAHQMIVNLFQYNMLPNMIGVHPPQQWDGNFGMTAAISEMFLQSQAGELDLLPALPKEWPDGSVNGLRARGGLTVDLVWKADRMTGVTLRCAWGDGGKVRYRDRLVELHLKPGQTVRLDDTLKKIGE